VRPNYGAGLGATALACEPHMEQLFVGAADGATDKKAFERSLFMLRRSAQVQCDATMPEDQRFYVCTLSSRVITVRS
jgi:glutamate synthase domain-containing protein 1